MALRPREAEDDIVNWCTGDEEGDVFLVIGLHVRVSGCVMCVMVPDPRGRQSRP